MGRENSGRGGLSPQQVTAILRMLASGATRRQVSLRAGVHYDTVRRLQKGLHRSQRLDAKGRIIDRRGMSAIKLRKIARMLGRVPPPSLSQIARRVGVERRVVGKVARGEHISQRDIRPFGFGR